MVQEVAKPIAHPKKKMRKGTGLSFLIGLLSFLLGAYFLAEYYGIFKFDFEIPGLTGPILLLLAGLLLLKETAQRSTMARLKSVYERYI